MQAVHAKESHELIFSCVFHARHKAICMQDKAIQHTGSRRWYLPSTTKYKKNAIIQSTICCIQLHATLYTCTKHILQQKQPTTEPGRHKGLSRNDVIFGILNMPETPTSPDRRLPS